MGVGQSRELLGKVDDDRVFVCTNREELLELLAKMQKVLECDKKKDREITEENLDNMEEHVETEKEKEKEEEEEETEEKKETGAADELINGGVDQQQEETTQEEKITSLTHVNNDDDDDVVVVAASSDDEYVPLEVIHVPNHYIGDDGFISGHPAILRSLAASTALRSLDVGYNALSGRSIEALIGNCSMPPNLLSLNLAGNAIGPIGCSHLAAFLETNPPLRELSLFNNRLYDSDVEPILLGLVKNTHLRFLNLDFNYLTDKFLRLLLELLQQNTTLAVVLFDGPYDQHTFERTRNVRAPDDEDVVPDEDDEISAKARALLRRGLLRADLAGRLFLPSALVQEVEAIIAPRRAEYIAEKKAEEELAEDLAKATAVAKAFAAAGRSSKSAECSVSSLQRAMLGLKERDDDDDNRGENGCDEKRGDEVSAESDGEELNVAENLSFVMHDGLLFDERHQLARHGAGLMRDFNDGDKDMYQSREFASQTSGTFLLASKTNRSLTRLADRETETSYSKCITPKKKRFSSITPVAARDSFLQTKKRTEVLGRELSNGFDRLVLVSSGPKKSAKTIWRKVSGPPCRLRPCWCDPRDAPATYGGLLHYHCKHEPTGGEMGEIGVDGAPLRDCRSVSQRPTQPYSRRTPLTVSSSNERMKKVPYCGCKATNHRCESIGFYGNPKPDKSSVFFFASRHPMCADVGEDDLEH